MGMPPALLAVSPNLRVGTGIADFSQQEPEDVLLCSLKGFLSSG
jgi:hypothetical protein